MKKKTSEERIEETIERYRIDPDSIIQAKTIKTQTQGKTLQELRQELRKLTQRANTRLQRLEETGLDERSSAYHSLEEYKGTHPRFSTKAKDKKQVLNKIRELEAFLEKKTSSVRGTRKVVKKQEEYLQEIGVDFEDDEDRSEFFELFNEYMSKSRQIKKNYSSTQIRDLMIDAYAKQLDKYGHVDKKRLYANVRASIRRYEEKKSKQESRDFKRLTGRARETRGR